MARAVARRSTAPNAMESADTFEPRTSMSAVGNVPKSGPKKRAAHFTGTVIDNNSPSSRQLSDAKLFRGNTVQKYEPCRQPRARQSPATHDDANHKRSGMP